MSPNKVSKHVPWISEMSTLYLYHMSPWAPCLLSVWPAAVRRTLHYIYITCLYIASISHVVQQSKRAYSIDIRSLNITYLYHMSPNKASEHLLSTSDLYTRFLYQMSPNKVSEHLLSTSDLHTRCRLTSKRACSMDI